MKKFFFSMMLATAFLASCSSESELKPGAGEVASGEAGYVGFTIQLPTTSGTRANDVFDDGEVRPDEYKVNNATLFLFQGADENNAEFLAAYPMNITNFKADGDGNDQCTTEGIVTAEIIKPSDDKLYAYVMLNNNGMVTVTQTNAGTTPASTTKVNGEDLAVGTTFAEFSKLTMAKLGDNGNLVMINAPVSNKKGGTDNPEGATITTLATLDKSKIFATQAKAQAGPAGEVYVERAAAKITVKTTMDDDAAITADANVMYDKASIRWAVNNVNKEYYNARQMDATWLPLVADGAEGTVNSSTKYRFVSNAAIHNAVFRTYFAKDMNYDNGDVTGFKANPTRADITNESDNSVYVTENTFDVANQKEKNTTGLSISATFNDGKDFYIASTYGANKILQIAGYRDDDKNQKESVADYIKDYLINNNSEFKTWAATHNDFGVAMDSTAGDGTAIVGSVSGTDLPSAINADYINGLIKFSYYQGGVAYYNLLIKHFGDDETPWNREKHTENTIAGIYGNEPTATQNFLGRYGIVRNNWYQVEIQGISQIGSPVVVTPGDTPDDKVNNYLSVRIHILPWAVRKQTVIL